MNVLFGESRVYITDQLRQELGWKRGDMILWLSPTGPVYRVINTPFGGSRLSQRGTEWYFASEIQGVKRGRLNGSRTCKYTVEKDGTLVLDVRELLAPENP